MNLTIPQQDLAFIVRLAYQGAQYAIVKYIKVTNCIDSDGCKYPDHDVVSSTDIDQDGVSAWVYVRAIGKDGRMYEHKLADLGKDDPSAHLLAGGLTLEWSK